MKESIKNRIEAVRRGEVPEGYVSKNHQLRPADWKYEKIGKYLVPYDEFSNDTEAYPLATSSRQGLMLQSEYYSDQRYEETTGGFHVVPVGYVTYRHMSDDDIFRFNVNKMGQPVLVSPEYPVFTTTGELDQELLVAYLNGMKEFQAFCSAQKKGSTRTRMYFHRLCEFTIPIPSITEQQKIAEILATCDRVIELKQQLLEEKRRQKQWLMQKLLDPNSGVKLPGFGTRAWKEIPLSEVFLYIRNGFVGTATPYYVDDGIPYIEGTNIQNGQWDLSEVLHISEEFHRQHSNSVLQAGDVVVVQSGHVGDCTVVTEEIAGSNSHAIIIMTPTPRINSHYCSCYINSPMGQGKLVGCITGNTVKHILASDMKNYLLPCPEKDEQDELATLFCAVEKEITAIEKEIEAWRQKKKALMQFLLTGLVRANA